MTDKGKGAAATESDDETALDATGTAAAAAAASFAALHNDANPADMPPFDATVAADEAEVEDEG